MAGVIYPGPQVYDWGIIYIQYVRWGFKPPRVYV